MKKVVVSVLSLATLGLGVAMPFQAKAEPISLHGQGVQIARDFRERNEYEVYYRRHRFQEWRFAGSFRHLDRAEREVRRLERDGYRTRIETRW